jgi:hypothetical protein
MESGRRGNLYEICPIPRIPLPLDKGKGEDYKKRDFVPLNALQSRGLAPSQMPQLKKTGESQQFVILYNPASLDIPARWS